MVQVVNPGEVGFKLPELRYRVVFADAVSKGGVCQLDLNNIDSGTTSTGEGEKTSVLSRVIEPNSYVATGAVGNIRAGIFCLAEKTQAAGSEGWALFSGTFSDALMTSAATTEGGSILTPQNGSNNLLLGTMTNSTGTGTGSKIIGQVLSVAVAGADTTPDIIFDGVNGFGTDQFR